MKKTLIALSLAALSGAAFADVTLYGQIRAGVEVSKVKAVEDGTAISGKSKTATELADFGSRIGFKGHESLGNGLNVIWKMEQATPVHGVNNLGSKHPWGNRQAYIGLETAAGTIRAGKISTPLDDMGKVDPWVYNNQAAGLGVFTRTGDKVLSVRYDSPVVAGFSGSLQYQLRDNQNPNDKYTHAEKTKAAYHAGLNYENSGFFAQYGLSVKKNNVELATEFKDGQAHRVEAGYDANNLLVAVGLQYTKGFDNEDVEGYVKRKEAAVTAAYTFGNVTPKVSYAHGWDAKVDGETIKGSKYNQVVVGADYDFSKRTAAFAQAGWLKEGSGDNYLRSTVGLVGLKHKF